MKKLILYTLLIILSWGVVTACGNEKDSESQSGNNSPETEHTETQAESAPSIQTGVFIDLNSIDNPLFNKDIKVLLERTLDSLANKKEKEFRSVFADEETADAYMYLFGKDYAFEKIGTVEEDQEGRIVVEIRGKVVSDNEVTTPNSYYYFVKNKQDKWSLGSID
jgi:hypothetical protein